VLDYVRGELKEARAELAKAQTEQAAAISALNALNTEFDSVKDLNAQLSAVVQDSVTRLRVALSMPARTKSQHQAKRVES
jgi:predicted  nucleic acid-binding Zn-ribbon protein